MEQQRTITKIRTLRITVMFSLLLLAYGVFMGIFLEMNKENLVRMLRNKAGQVLSSKYESNMTYAIKVCDNAFDYLVKSQQNAILFGLLGLVSVVYLVRMPITQRQKSLSSLLMIFGASMLTLYYLMVGVMLPEMAKLQDAKSFLSWLLYPSVVIFGLGTLLVLYHSFRKIVVES